MAKTEDKDLSLKLRFRKILFSQGYWCPIEVALSQYEASGTTVKRVSLTDLDVLGLRYDNLFSRSVVVGDCKSGKNVSDISRLFWIKGVSEYFGADQAYFIHTTIGDHARSIAPKLGLRILDESALLALEDGLRVVEHSLPWNDLTTYQSITKLWGIDVPKDTKPDDEHLRFKKVYSYLSYSYWYISQHRNLLNTVEHFREIASLLDAGNSRHVLLAYGGLERFVHSLLEAITFVFTQGSRNIPIEARKYIYGGNLDLKEKEQFFRLLRSLTKSNEQLDPPYLNDIIELIARMLRNPAGACDLLRHISAIYLWCVHLKNKNMVPLNRDGENTAAIVLSRDAANTFCKASGISQALFADLASL
jgi:hypothetical protein